MKKRMIVLGATLTAIAITGCLFLFAASSPEYVLKQTVSDIEEDGIAGLKRHLSHNALNKMEILESLSAGFQPEDLVSSLNVENAAKFVLKELSGIDWTIANAFKDGRQADALVRFTYHEEITG